MDNERGKWFKTMAGVKKSVKEGAEREMVDLNKVRGLSKILWDF